MSRPTRFIFGAMTAPEIFTYRRGEGRPYTDADINIAVAVSERLKTKGTMARIEEWVDRMVAEDNDAVVFTLNPLVLNFLPDDFAKENLYYLDSKKTLHLVFSDARCLKKLRVLGPGEVVCDTDLEVIFNSNA